MITNITKYGKKIESKKKINNIDVNKKLMMVTVSQILEKNLILNNDSTYTEFKKLYNSKDTTFEELKQGYNKIIKKCINNKLYTKDDTMSSMIEIFQDIEKFKTEHLVESEKIKLATIHTKLNKILKLPFILQNTETKVKELE